MTTHAQALAVKDQVAKKLRRMGIVVVSVGVEILPAGPRVAVGVSRGFNRLPTKDWTMHDVPVHVFEEGYGRLASR